MSETVATTSSTATASPAGVVPRPEHPRPDFQREPWINLNGRWRFTFDPHDAGEQARWYRAPHPELGPAGADSERGASYGTTSLLGPVVMDPFATEIVVPFPWESRLSGVGDQNYKGVAWYQRVIEVPADWAAADAPAVPPGAQGLPSVEDAAGATSAIGARVQWRRHPVLCFGAIDWNTKVWVNGRFVAEHDGGYTPFDVDISRYVRPGRPATLTVRVWDTSAADTPIGKQTDRWYTHSGGIWQTVWLEGRPAAYLSHLHVTPHLDAGSATLAVIVGAAPEATGAYRLAVTSTSAEFPPVERTIDIQSERAQASLEVRLPQPRAWSPEDPYLYACSVSLTPQVRGSATASRGSDEEGDQISTYFGLRSLSTGRWEDRPYEFVLLNGQPVYLRGALDQAFHPDGLHTYPSDDAIRADIQSAKDLGLNMLRCHIKINEPRYYYWADKLGVLIMYDLPSAGIYTPKARANWERTFRDALARDASHPSIFSWILFNETWGLEEHRTPASWVWVNEMYRLAKELDPTRLVEDNSACLFDHVVSDINTWHFYIDDYSRAKRHVERVVGQTYEGSSFNYVGSLYHHDEDMAARYRQGAYPLLNSEYAGLGASGGDRDISYTFKFLTTELRRHDKICGYVYTELTDIEWEHNGFLNYDRTSKEFGYDAFVPGMQVADLNGADFVGLDCAPCQTVPPGSLFRADAFVSHWSPRDLAQAALRWRITAIDRCGESLSVDEGQRAVQPRRYGVTLAGAIETRLPDTPCLVTAAIWLVDENNTVLARNYVNVDVYTRETTLPAASTANGHAVSFAPEDFADCSWPNPMLGRGGVKFGASGAGWVEYVVPLPEVLDRAALQRIQGIQLRFEAAARTARSRIGWNDPVRVQRTDYPQTEARKLGTDLTVSINGVELGSVSLPDDPADARGVLSVHLNAAWEFASYGFLTTLAADLAKTQRIVAAALESTDRQLVIRFEVPRSGTRGGLNLYGARMGAYPFSPTVFFEV